MPAKNIIPLPKKMHALALIDTQKSSIRNTADSIGIAKSTLHDNLGSYRREVSEFEKWRESSEEGLVRNILSLTLEGKVSSRDSETIMATCFEKSISHQKILNVLETAGQVAEEIGKVPTSTASGEPLLAKIDCLGLDEVFQNRSPILGGVDLESGYVMLTSSGDRTEGSWTDFLNSLKDKGLSPATITTDGGKSILKGIKNVFAGVPNFRDLFHVIEKLGRALRVIEGACYRKIISFDDGKCEEEFLNQLIEAHDRFWSDFKAFQNGAYFSHEDYLDSDQTANLIANMQEELSTILDLGINHSKVKDAKTYIENAKVEIVAYKKYLEEIISKAFEKDFGGTELRLLCSVIEILDQIQRSKENRKRIKYWQKKLIEAVENLRESTSIDQENIDAAINKVATQMRKAKKSNSMTEALNSVIRNYLVTYKSIPKWFCSLFSYYWNHKRFKRGKRAGLKPIEILSGECHSKHWIEGILERYPFKLPQTEAESA